MTESGSQDLTLTQTQTQDGDWFGSQAESQEITERRPWGRISPRKIMLRRLGNQAVTLQESLSATFGKLKFVIFFCGFVLFNTSILLEACITHTISFYDIRYDLYKKCRRQRFDNEFHNCLCDCVQRLNFIL